MLTLYSTQAPFDAFGMEDLLNYYEKWTFVPQEQMFHFPKYFQNYWNVKILLENIWKFELFIENDAMF